MRADPFRLYVAGPMTGLPDHNYPAFNDAALRLRGKGFLIENPVSNSMVNTPELDDAARYRLLLRLGLMQMMLCDGVALLPDWDKSYGATLEREVARKCGLVVYTVQTWLSDDAGVDANGDAYVRKSLYRAGFTRNLGQSGTPDVDGGVAPMTRPYTLPLPIQGGEGYDGREQAGL